MHPKAEVEKREYFKECINKHQAVGTPIVYIDESGFAHDMPRPTGMRQGKRCYDRCDWGARGRTNVIGAQLA